MAAYARWWGVRVDVVDGNDTVRTTGLTVDEVLVYGGPVTIRWI